MNRLHCVFIVILASSAILQCTQTGVISKTGFEHTKENISTCVDLENISLEVRRGLLKKKALLPQPNRDPLVYDLHNSKVDNHSTPNHQDTPTRYVKINYYQERNPQLCKLTVELCEPILQHIASMTTNVQSKSRGIVCEKIQKKLINQALNASQANDTPGVIIRTGISLAIDTMVQAVGASLYTKQADIIIEKVIHLHQIIQVVRATHIDKNDPVLAAHIIAGPKQENAIILSHLQYLLDELSPHTKNAFQALTTQTIDFTPTLINASLISTEETKKLIHSADFLAYRINDFFLDEINLKISRNGISLQRAHDYMCRKITQEASLLITSTKVKYPPPKGVALLHTP